MSQIRDYINAHLLEPLRRYPTAIQDTLLSIIANRLEELYNYTLEFPKIISPNSSRLDILQAIADQFLFTVREEADLEEQVRILESIVSVYNKRGSIDTIENMWKYYGGDLPKEVKVKIPSYNLFRYGISQLSGTHVFPDNQTNRTGVYEIRLTNNFYPVEDLREFLIKELVAAGNYIYFTNNLYLGLTESDGDNTHYDYLVQEDTLIQSEILLLRESQGFNWSGLNPVSRKSEDSAWSGRASLFLEITKNALYEEIDFSDFSVYYNALEVIPAIAISSVLYRYEAIKHNQVFINEYLYYTEPTRLINIDRNLYSIEGELLKSPYPGYFVLGESLLGEEVI